MLWDCHNKLEVRPALPATEPQVLVARRKKGLFLINLRTMWALPKSSGCFLTFVFIYIYVPLLNASFGKVTRGRKSFPPSQTSRFASHGRTHSQWAGLTSSPPSLQMTNPTIKEQRRAAQASVHTHPPRTPLPGPRQHTQPPGRVTGGAADAHARPHAGDLPRQPARNRHKTGRARRGKAAPVI